jgi:hypothetical protein
MDDFLIGPQSDEATPEPDYAVTEAAYDKLTEEVAFRESGFPVYECVCGDSVVNLNGSECWQHAESCMPLRLEAIRG